MGDLNRLGLGVEGDKLELMHFWQHRSPWHPDKPLGPDLVLRDEGCLIRLQAKANMRYLGFFLDPRLSFKAHVRFYANKAASTVNALRMLGNSSRGLDAVRGPALVESAVEAYQVDH